MNKAIIFLALLVFLIAACETKPDAGKNITVDSGTKGTIECRADSDCVTGGCSGTICQSKNAEPIFTTCEYRPEYACYNQISCKCIEGKCDWGKTADFDRCVEQARKTNTEVIV